MKEEKFLKAKVRIALWNEIAGEAKPFVLKYWGVIKQVWLSGKINQYNNENETCLKDSGLKNSGGDWNYDLKQLDLKLKIKKNY